MEIRNMSLEVILVLTAFLAGYAFVSIRIVMNASNMSIETCAKTEGPLTLVTFKALDSFVHDFAVMGQCFSVS